MIDIHNLKIYDILDIRKLNWSLNLLLQKAGGSWGGHITPVIVKDGRVGTGDSHVEGSEWQPLRKLEDCIDNGEIEVRVYRPRGYTAKQILAANAWWLDNVNGISYDYLAYIGLTIKVLLWDRWQLDTGRESKWYCVEGTVDGLRYGAGETLMDGEIYTVRALERLAENSDKLDLVGML